MPEYVWVYESELYPTERKLILTPKELVEIREFKRQASQNEHLQKTLEEISTGTISGEKKVIAGHRGGGGVLIFHGEDEPGVLLMKRSDDAPREPNALDIAAGLMSGVKSKSQPPGFIVIVSEAYEIIPALVGKDSIKMYLPSILTGNSTIDFFLATTALNTAAILGSYLWGGKRLEISYIPGGCILGRFRRSVYKVIERSPDGNSSYTYDALITAEPKEGSIEFIMGTLMLHPSKEDTGYSFLDAGLRGKKARDFGFSYVDGEHITMGDPQLNDVGIVGGSFKPLGREIVKINSDATVNVYKDGKTLDHGIEPEKFIEKYGIGKAIREGRSSGATSKVQKVGEEGKKGNSVIFRVDDKEREYSLRPIAIITELLKSYGKKS